MCILKLLFTLKSKPMKGILTVVLMLTGCLLVNAQSYKGSGGAFSVGVQSVSDENLPLVTQSGGDIPDVAFNFGGYMYWQFGRWTLGGKLYGLSASKTDNADFQQTLSAGAVMAELGYKIVYSEKNAFYPFIGAGYAGISYQVDITSDVHIGMPRNLWTSGSFLHDFAVFDVGARWEHFICFNNKEATAGLIGLEAGYQFTPAGNNWKTIGGGDLIGVSEDYNFNGWFVKFTFGGFNGMFE